MVCSRFVLPLSCFILLCAAACKKEDDAPIPQPNTVAVIPDTSVQGKPAVTKDEYESIIPVEKQQNEAEGEQEKRRFKNPVLRFRKPLPPKEKGDTYAEFFMGMEGKIGKELGPSASASTWTLQDIRIVEHEYFDRIVFEFDGEEPPGYELEYLELPARLCNSGIRVRTQGQEQIQLTIHSARASTNNGATPTQERYKLSLPIMRELVRSCDQDGTLTFVVGTSSRKNFRLGELQNPARIMLDLRNNKQIELEEGEEQK